MGTSKKRHQNHWASSCRLALVPSTRSVFEAPKSDGGKYLLPRIWRLLKSVMGSTTTGNTLRTQRTCSCGRLVGWTEEVKVWDQVTEGRDVRSGGCGEQHSYTFLLTHGLPADCRSLPAADRHTSPAAAELIHVFLTTLQQYASLFDGIWMSFFFFSIVSYTL